MRTGLPKSGVAPRRANITIPRCQSRAAAPRPRERSRHPPHHRHTHRRGATALCHNPVRGAQRSVPGLNTPLLSACRRYATTPEPESDRASGLVFSNPRQRRGYTHRRTCAAERRRWHTPAMHLQRHRTAVHLSISTLSPDALSGVN